MQEKKVDWSINYEAFAHALLRILDLHGEAKVYPYGIDINPRGHLDGALFIWLVAHATSEQIADALQAAQQPDKQ
jgi:hypothetical protein